jgi:L-amino acid N-acyltransferase YncA
MRSQLANYRNLITLADGTRVLFRPLGPDDREALVNLFSCASEEDRRYLVDDVTDRELVTSWVDNLNYNKVFPLMAVINDRIVGDATLHFRKGAYRHQGELRIYLSREVRRRGLGTRMLQALIELGRNQGLHQLIAEVVRNQASVIKAFEELGFIRQCTLLDYFMLPDGSTHDVALMVLTLVEHRGEF